MTVSEFRSTRELFPPVTGNTRTRRLPPPPGVVFCTVRVTWLPAASGISAGRGTLKTNCAGAVFGGAAKVRLTGVPIWPVVAPMELRLTVSCRCTKLALLPPFESHKVTGMLPAPKVRSACSAGVRVHTTGGWNRSTITLDCGPAGGVRER